MPLLRRFRPPVHQLNDLKVKTHTNPLSGPLLLWLQSNLRAFHFSLAESRYLRPIYVKKSRVYSYHYQHGHHQTNQMRPGPGFRSLQGFPARFTRTVLKKSPTLLGTALPWDSRVVLAKNRYLPLQELRRNTQG